MLSPVVLSRVGKLFISGIGEDRDLEPGPDWLQVAARSGRAELFARLASLYREGQAVEDYRPQDALWASLAEVNRDRSTGMLISDSRRSLTVAERSQLEKPSAALQLVWPVSSG